MFGMETMSSSASILKDVEWFKNLFISFENNPFLGILVGLVVTAIIQSSSASVGILQAFALTGQITYTAAIPIILGQNIGTCVTAIISSVGANKNAKRASLIHLLFNVIGTLIAVIIYLIVWKVFNPLILSSTASLVGIAIVHSAFNVFCTILLFPFSNLLEKIVCKIIKSKEKILVSEIDDRLLNTPAIALEQVEAKIIEMSSFTKVALNSSMNLFLGKIDYEAIYNSEDETDRLEDLIGSYLVKLSTKELNSSDSRKANIYLKIIGELERIADHSLNISEVKKEMDDKNMVLSDKANKELKLLFNALTEIWNYTFNALKDNDLLEAMKVEPLEQTIDILVKTIRDNHIKRIQTEECSIEKGFILADLLSNIERISDHCSNIALYIYDNHNNNLSSHENILEYKRGEKFKELFRIFYNDYIEVIEEDNRI